MPQRKPFRIEHLHRSESAARQRGVAADPTLELHSALRHREMIGEIRAVRALIEGRAQEAQRARLVVQQRQQEAEQRRVEAQGLRDAEVTRAEGQAQATILQARAEAEALRLVSEQIAANPALIQYQYIQTLGDNIRLALVPSNSPFLFDFESIAANPDFVAPEIPESSDIIVPTAEPAPGS